MMIGNSRVSRRNFLKGSAAVGTTLAAGTVFAPAVHAAASIKIGYVSPQTGPLAPFGEADDFVVKNFLEGMGASSLSAGPTTRSRWSSRTASPTRTGPRRSLRN